MLNDMLSFNLAFMQSLATILGSEPMIYFVGLFMLAIIVRLFVGLIKLR